MNFNLWWGRLGGRKGKRGKGKEGLSTREYGNGYSPKREERGGRERKRTSRVTSFPGIIEARGDKANKKKERNKKKKKKKKSALVLSP